MRLGDVSLPEAPGRERKAWSSQEPCLCFSRHCVPTACSDAAHVF